MASFFFTISNACKTEMAARVGTVAMFYNSIGQFITCVAFFTISCLVNLRTRQVCWQNQNFIVDGVFMCRNLVGFCSNLFI